MGLRASVAPHQPLNTSTFHSARRLFPIPAPAPAPAPAPQALRIKRVDEVGQDKVNCRSSQDWSKGLLEINPDKIAG